MLLLELNNNFNINDKIFYSGWAYVDPSQEQAPKVSCLHHVNIGFPMKFSKDEHYATSYQTYYWKITPELGQNEIIGASAGAPFYNEYHFVTGIEWGDEYYDCNLGKTSYNWGGKFSESWIGGGTDASSLHHWLAPNWNSGDLSMEGQGYPVYIWGRDLDMDDNAVPVCDINTGMRCKKFFNIDDLYIGGGCHNNKTLPFYASLLAYDSTEWRSGSKTEPDVPFNLEFTSPKRIIIKPCTKINWGVHLVVQISCSNDEISDSDNWNDYCNNCSLNVDCNMPPPRYSSAEKSENASSQKLQNTLYQNKPNPFSESTDIAYYLSEAGPVKITVFNSLGVQVAELVNLNQQKPGRYTVTFKYNTLEPGVYFYTMTCGDFRDVKKMMLIK